MQKRSETPGDPHAPGGRRKRVRSRLVIGVALTGLTVLAAGAPMLLTASQDLNDSQRLVTRAELNRQAVTLAHSLADERDDMTAYVAAGRGKQPAGEETGAAAVVDSALSARVDRQIAEIRAAAPAELRRELAGVPDIRRTARTGTDTAMAAHRAYTKVVGRLLTLSTELADRVPARAAEAGSGARALTELGQATDQASATRGLLLAALSVPGGDGRKNGDRTVYDPATGTFVPVPDPADETAERTRNELTAAAQQSRVREQAALGDFGQTAPAAARDSLSATVTGPEVKAAEDALAQLTDRPELSESEQGTDPEGLAASLTARIEQMRGVESALATDEIARMERLRDDDVTGLELRVGVLGALLLLAIAISTAVARSLTRPLSVLRRGAARLAEAPAPQTEEPVRFTGRNDEFAQVVRSINTLHGKLAVLADRASAAPAAVPAPAAAPAPEVRDGAARAARNRAEAAERERDALAAELAAHRAEAAEHTAELAALTAELARLRDTAEHTFVNLSLRTLGLVERQLGVIEKLEEREQDPDRLATLFRLDHLATVMRRHSENLLVLAGHEHHHAHQGPVPLVDVARAAVSEIERYERVVLQSLPPHAHVAGFAADDLSHLLAELLENATSFSPPDAKVQLSGWLLESGEVMLSVEDTGIGVPPERLAELNACLADPATPTEIAADPDGDSGTGLGMRVTALLAARHGVRVELRAQQQGGLTAVTVLPPTLLAEAPPAELPPSVPADPSGPALAQPGSVAEANSHTLPGARPRPDAGAPGVVGGHEARGAAEESAADDQSAETPEANEVGETAEASVTEGAADVPEAIAAPHDTTQPETTLQVRLPRPATGAPDEAHARADEAPQAAAASEETPAVDPADEDEHHRPHEPKWERVTDKGLPKRTPRAVPQSAPPAGRAGGVDAEALRRRLGGFQQGARDGRRDAEAEIAGERGTEAAAGQAAPAAREWTVHTEDTGDTVEEARG